jgi:hypothetical protein
MLPDTPIKVAVLDLAGTTIDDHGIVNSGVIAAT